MAMSDLGLLISKKYGGCRINMVHKFKSTLDLADFLPKSGTVDAGFPK